MNKHSLSLKHLGRVIMLLIFVIILLTTSDMVVAQPLFQLSISINPTSGKPGTIVTMSGSGWGSNTSGHEIHWDSTTGLLLGTFSSNPNGAFTTNFNIPSGAAPGQHTIWVCDRCNSPFKLAPPVWISANFNVLLPATSTPTRVPPTPTPTDIPTVCDALGLPGELVIDFEGSSTSVIEIGAEIHPGVIYRSDLRAQVIRADVATKSFSHALVNSEMMEFGSINDPLRFGFIYLQDFVGVYVGLNNPRWADGPLTATMTARGYPCEPDEEGRFACPPGIVGTDSVSFGPAATPVKECLSIEAPNIFEVIIDYGPAADPEIIDNLTLRGPEEPEPLPEDDNPPIVTIELPESGVVQPTNQVRLQGEVREDRELAQMRYRVNSGPFHDMGFTSAGYTPEGERLYLFAVDPLPVDEIRTCGDNLVEVIAVDASDNEGMGLTAFSVYYGDLAVTSVEAVQVVYGADLVHGKGTAFRARVNSTYSCQILAKFRLELPDDQWDTSPPLSGRIVPAAPADWSYPEIWGPIPIPANAAGYSVMLPYIEPGQEEALFNPSSNPAGVLKDRHLPGWRELPDVRVVPRPIGGGARFTVEIDPENNWPETDETNNRLPSRGYLVVTTRSMCFYVVPVQSAGSGPVESLLNIKPQVEFLLATYPLADDKVTWRIAPATSETCSDPDHPGDQCVWAISDSSDFLSTASTMAKRNDCDYAIAIWRWGGGSTCGGCTHGAVIGDEGWAELLAHEFNHSMTAVPDMYSLDCMVAWDELYCEFSAGNRSYYCQNDTSKPDGYSSLNCRCEAGNMDDLACSVDEMVCEIEEKACEMYTGCSEYRREFSAECQDPAPVCNEACARATAVAECSGEIGIDKGPDCRILHPTSEGFWVNRWEHQPEGLAYLMDCGAPRYWTRLGNSYDHCGIEGSYNDGYSNTLSNDNFDTGEDPEALLVRGRIYPDGHAELGTFVYLPSANLDRAPGAAGDYRFALLDDADTILSQTGFDVTFQRTGNNPQQLEYASFVMRIEWKPGTQKITLVDKTGRELAAVNISGNLPSVKVLSPNGGEFYRFGRMTTVRWEAGDEDADRLTYFVDLSPDGGETWFSLAIDLEDREYRFDTSLIGEGSEYLVRVLASDGVNTAEDVSDAVFTISNEAALPARNLILVGLIIMGLLGMVALIGAVVMFMRRRAA